MAKPLTKKKPATRRLLEIRLTFDGDSAKPIVDAFRRSAALSMRNYQQHAKYLIWRGLEMEKENG